MAGGFGPHILGPASGVKADYDPIADFTHVVMMGGETYIFAAHVALGVKSLADVVRLASDKPVNFGSPGTGTLGQLMVDQFRLKVGASRINHVPYRGGAPLQTDFIGNHVSLATLPIAPMLPHVSTGTIVALAVSSTERNPALPDVPTLNETGYPEIGGAIWFWLAGPKNLPQPVVARVNQEVRRYLATAPVKQIFVRDALHDHGRRRGRTQSIHRRRDQTVERDLSSARTGEMKSSRSHSSKMCARRDRLNTSLTQFTKSPLFVDSFAKIPTNGSRHPPQSSATRTTVIRGRVK